MSAGMIYFDELSNLIRKLVLDEKELYREMFNATSIFDPRFSSIGQHIQHGIMVFVNPYVAALPGHHHLFSGDGCYKGSLANIDGGEPCTGEDMILAQYDTLLRCYKNEAKAKAIGKSMNDMYWTCVKNERLAKVGKR
jgi:hypothetical protein